MHAGLEFFQALYTIAKYMPEDVSHIESLHTTARRLLMARNVQINVSQLGDLSALCVLQQHRRNMPCRKAKKKTQRDSAMRAKQRRRAANT